MLSGHFYVFFWFFPAFTRQIARFLFMKTEKHPRKGFLNLTRVKFRQVPRSAGQIFLLIYFEIQSTFKFIYKIQKLWKNPNCQKVKKRSL